MTRVGEHEPEGGGDALSRGAAADVEEIRRTGARVLDHVHRRHRQTRAIDDAADFAVQSDVVEIVFQSLRLPRIALRGVLHVDDVAPAEQRVVVEGHLRVERQDLVVLGHDQRIDLEHRRVAIAKSAIGAENRLHRARHLLQIEAEPEGELARLKRLQPDRRLDDDLQQLVGRVLGDLLDLHAAMLGGDHAHTLELPVENIAEIDLALERIGELDIHALHGLALGPRLRRDEALAEELARRLLHLVVGAAEFDAPRLAARARMDLRLDDPVRSAKLSGRVDGLIGAKGDRPGRHRDAVLRQKFLGLILVDVHSRLPLTEVLHEPILPRTTS